MMTSSEDKKRWKKESEQLKDDLKKRKKVIKKREVNITFPKKKPKLTPTQSNTINNMEQFLKQQINLEESH